MLKIKFLGAAGEVTGSSFLVTAGNGNQILIDFGMFQGKREIEALNYQKLDLDMHTLKGVFLTHAHLDHSGRLPLLVFGGYLGKIYMSDPTLSLIDIILTDSAGLQKEAADHAPLYTEDEVYKVLDMVEVVEYDKDIVVENFTVKFKDAGHILGSGSIKVIDNLSGESIVFSGDLGNTPEDIVRPTDFFEAADFVVMEATYGDRLHPKDDPTKILQTEINNIENSGGVLLIPAFSVERTQEIMHRIGHLKSDGKVKLDTPVFLDSPMGIHATGVFEEFKTFYNDELLSHTDDPFKFEGLVITEETRDSKDIARAMDPKVIIAGSGMLSGGRILHHAAQYLPKSDTVLLFAGYQAEGTLGRKILDGARKVNINNQTVKVNAQIREILSLSSHADQNQLVNWLSHVKGVKKVFIVHAEDNRRIAFKQKIGQDLNIQNVFLPKVGEEFVV